MKKGVDCVLLDRATFPRDKICGGGLTARAYKLLQRLLPEFHYDYNSVQQLHLSIEGRQVLDFQMGSELRVVKRADFDKQLLDEYLRAGGAFIKAITTVSPMPPMMCRASATAQQLPSASGRCYALWSAPS